MSLTASQIIERANNKIHRAKNKLGGDSQMTILLDEALVKLREDVNLQSAKRQSSSFIVYRDIHEYPSPEDISMDKTIRLFDDRGVIYNLTKTDPVNFYDATAKQDRRYHKSQSVRGIIPGGARSDGYVSVDQRDSDDFLLIYTPSLDLPNITTAHGCDSVDGNGTWVVSDDATNILTDNQTYKKGTGSIYFDSQGLSTDITVSVPDAEAVDLSNVITAGKAFLWVYIPEGGTPDSITLDFGDDSSNYYQVVSTVCQNNLTFREGWNLVGFDMLSKTTTGSPTSTSVNYFSVKLTVSTAVATTGFRIDSLRFALGKAFTLDYYSSFLMVNANTSARQETVENTGDRTILVREEDTMLVDELAILALEELREWDEAQVRKQYLMESKEMYRQKYPSQEMVEGFSYYNTNTPDRYGKR